MINLVPRPYQIEAQEALENHLKFKETHPCVVIPTGGGKSIMIGWALQKWKLDYPPLRAIVVAHRKELVSQNANEFKNLWPAVDVGIYSAGLNRKDIDHSITFASIDSVYKIANYFPPFDVLIVDEAHRIPLSEEASTSKYRRFIKDCKNINKNIRIIGFTATPYRMSGGAICHRDHILQEICYEANLCDLINQGYLCKLRSKVSEVQPDLSQVKRHKDDYVIKSLAAAVDVPNVVKQMVRSAVSILQQENRKSTIFYCVDIKHCHDVSMELRNYGYDAKIVTGKTPAKKRDRIVQEFREGRIKAICNVNVYTEGFNVQRVDSIVLARPTLSAPLFQQMVGRGLRIHSSKTDCLVLDYARCIETHGPIDQIEGGDVRLTTCEECGDTFSFAVRKCPNCGWIIPKRVIDKADAEERERKMHEIRHSNLSILSEYPESIDVDSVMIHRHRKLGKPDSIKVQYRCGKSSFLEWICLDHGGLAEIKAKQWLLKRFNVEYANSLTVNDVIEHSNQIAEYLNRITKTITVVKKGKYFEIVGYEIDKREDHDGNGGLCSSICKKRIQSTSAQAKGQNSITTGMATQSNNGRESNHRMVGQMA